MCDRIPLGEGNYDRLPALAAELVRRRVAVIAAYRRRPPGACGQGAQRRQFQSCSSPAATRLSLGLVASLNRPGGNVTGVNWFSLTRSRQSSWSCCMSWCPRAIRIAVLVNPTRSAIASQFTDAQHGRTYTGSASSCLLNASTESEIDAAFATLVRERGNALWL